MEILARKFACVSDPLFEALMSLGYQIKHLLFDTFVLVSFGLLNSE